MSTHHSSIPPSSTLSGKAVDGQPCWKHARLCQSAFNGRSALPILGLLFLCHLKNGKGVLSLSPSHNFPENEHPFNTHSMTRTVCRCVQLKGKELVVVSGKAGSQSPSVSSSMAPNPSVDSHSEG